MCLLLKSDKNSCQKWYLHAALMVKSDFKLHTGEALAMGKGAIIYVSQKKKEHKNNHGGGVSRSV